MRLVLASASPRRADLLRAAGYAFDVVPADIDERRHGGEHPEAYVARVAAAKADRVAATIPGACVVGADTTVVVDAAVLGKPADADEARAMLERLSGREHVVLTGVAVRGNGLEADETVSTRVGFVVLTGAAIDWYVASGEPMDKAGGYAIQGLGARFVDRIDGSYSNVVGLPVATVARLLERLGCG